MAQVLLIEADQPLAATAQKFLQARGHAVKWHVDPQLAMDDVDSKLPDVIVLDLLLAGRSGVEFLYELRSYPDWQSLPVIVYSHISAGDLGSSASGFEQLGISAFLYKPLASLAELNQSIEQILQPAVV